MDIQLRFLRVLEQREVFRLGGEKVIHVDIRVIAATNRNLWNLVKEGKFREDLYYRLNVLEVHLPALRERREDIPLLVDYFLKGFRPDLSGERRREMASLPELASCGWPGNIRQLKNVAERMAVLYRESMDLQRLARQALGGGAEAAGRLEACGAAAESSSAVPVPSTDVSAWIRADRVRREREEILVALRECGGRRDQAAGLLGISRSTLWRRMRECGIQDESQNSSNLNT